MRTLSPLHRSAHHAGVPSRARALPRPGHTRWPGAVLVAALLLGVLLAAPAASAQQLRISLNVSARPNPFLSEWASRRETVILVITNTTGAPVDAKIDARIFLNGTLVAQTKLDQMKPITARPGVTTLYADEVIPFNDVKVYGNNEQRAAQTGMLPAGTYSFCVTLVDPANTGRTLSEQVCKPFTLTSYQLPVLVLPTNKASLTAPARPTFRWTPIVPRPPFSVRYIVRAWEVQPGQTPMQAFRVNQPVLQREVVDVVQLLYPADLPLPIAGREYIWTVQALNQSNGQPVFEPSGYADPFTFRVEEGARRQGGNEGGVRLGDQAGRDAGGGNAGGVRRDTDTLAVDGGGGARRDAGGGGGGAGERRAAGGGDDVRLGGGGIDGGVLYVDDGPNMRRAQAGQQNNQAPPVNNSPCGGNCTGVVTITDTVAAGFTLANNDTVKMGRFAMKLTDVTTGAAGNLSGKGEIYVPWLLTRIAVKYQGLKVNADSQVYRGSAYAVVDSTAPVYPQQWGINIVGNWNWLKDKVIAVDAWLKQKGQIVSQFNGLQKPVELPLGLNNLKGYTLAISELKFTEDTAFASAVMSVPIAKHDDTLSFGVSSVSICPQGIARCATLNVLNDITVRGLTPNQISFSLTLKARTNARQGTYVAWTCNNFDTLAVDIDVAFPRAWIVPRPDADTTKQSIATLTGKIVDWKEWMLMGRLPASTFVGTNGLAIAIDSLTLDYTDLANPPSIVFPPNYVGTQGNDFNGLWAKNITVYCPDGWRTFSNPAQVPVGIARNLIIAKTGFTGDLIAANVIQYPDANLNRLRASVDTVRAVFVNSTLTQAYMRGKLTLPVTDTTVTNALMYKALFNNTQKRFDFSMTPKDSLTFSLFAGAKLKLNGTSALTMSISKAAPTFALKLNGEVGWNDKEITIGPKKIKVDMSPEFENLGINYNDSTGKMVFTDGNWSFASPQKKLAKFPVTIKDIKFTQPAAQAGEVARANVKFNLVVSLDSNRIGGTGGFEVLGAVKKSTGDAKFKFTPAFLDFNVTKITVFANLAAVKLDGQLDFYNSDPTWGDGFVASLKATFNSLQMEVSANARFGSKVSNANTRYRYWYVDAKAILPPPGIPFVPGYAFYGFGASAWRRVNVDMTGAKPNVATVAAANTTTQAPNSGAVMTPDPNIGFGFGVKAVLGTTPDPSKMNCDIGLAGQFTNSGGMSKLGVSGDLWLKARLTERNKAPVYGSLNLQYDFIAKIFDLNATVNVNKPPVTGNGALKVHLEGKTGIWYVKLGDPVNRVTLNVDMLGTTISSNSYFMFGKNISPPSGFTQRTLNGLASVSSSLSPPSASATTSAISGNGFAAGLETGFNTGQRDKHLFGRVNVRYQAAGGFEMNLSLLRYPDGTGCSGGGLLEGMNMWYVQGNVAAYAIASASIHIEPKDCKPCLCVCCEKKHENGCDINIASLKLGAYLLAGFPKPSWLEGAAAGSFSVLAGAFSGNFTAEINVGTKCNPAPPSGPSVAAQDVGAEQATKLIASIEPANNATGVPVTEPVRVIYSFPPNESFDMQEQTGGAAGDMINRTFQARYTVTVDKRVQGTWVAQTIVSAKDALGAYLYRLKAPLQMNNQGNQNIMMNDGGQPQGGPQVGGQQNLRRNANPGVGVVINQPVGGGGAPHGNAAVNAGHNNAMNDPEVQPVETDNFGFSNSAAQAFINSTRNWDSSSQYRITVVGTLWEFKNNAWVVAKRRSNNTDIKQTETYVFNTPANAVAGIGNNAEQR